MSLLESAVLLWLFYFILVNMGEKKNWTQAQDREVYFQLGLSNNTAFT